MITNLTGRAVLIIEDEPLIALDIATAFELVGATAVLARTVADARRLVETDGLSAAVVDFGLADGEANEICRRLEQRAIPFVVHTGYADVRTTWLRAAAVRKPASPDAVIAAISKLLDG